LLIWFVFFLLKAFVMLRTSENALLGPEVCAYKAR
jgi:hypothetical protein